MIAFNYYIAINQSYEIRTLIDCTIEKSVNRLAAFTRLTLGNKRGFLDNQIKRGDGIEIFFGYGEDLRLEFVGYVDHIKIERDRMMLYCEDEAWQFKQSPIKQSFSSASTTLKDLLEAIVGTSQSLEVPGITVGKYTLDFQTKYEAIEELADTYNLAAFIRETGQLFVGIPQTETQDTDVTVSYKFQNNVLTDGNDLEFVEAATVNLEVEAISILPNNTKLTAKVGTSGGARKTMTFYNITDQAELEAAATRRLEDFKYDGYRGGFRSLGVPYAQPTWYAELTDDDYPERAGVYYIERTVVEVTKRGGFKRNLKLGQKLLSNANG